jgi:hypothetical protein
VLLQAGKAATDAAEALLCVHYVRLDGMDVR